MKKITFVFSLLVILGFGSCDKNDNVIFFSIEDDKQLGLQVRDEIAANPTEFPVLSESEYPEAYQHIRRITTNILNSGEVAYKDVFAWEVRIIHKDDVLNAFATPGGYIYVYTGLIKYLDSEDHLAGVMGHEIAHADQRHSMSQLQKQYGLSIVLSAILGNDPSTLEKIVGQITGQLASLQFSRSDENEADEKSVEYLAKMEGYACNGVAGFFEKLQEEEQAGRTPEFLSTHPNPDNRITNINEKAAELNCNTTPGSHDYQALKNSLPQ